MTERKTPQRSRLTKTFVEGLKPDPAGVYVVNDDKQVGLSIRVLPSGSKVFCSFRKIDGRPTRLMLGRFGEVSCEQARVLAAKIGSEIADGKNPATVRKARREELTFGQLFDRYMREHAQPHKRSWRTDQAVCDRYLFAWTTKRLSSITRSEIQSRHQAIGAETPTAANRTLSLVSKVFSFAMSVEVFAGPNPCLGIRKYAEKSRDRFLRADEMPRFWQALNEEPNECARDFFKVALLTGARRANVLAMQWSELRLDRAEWVIPLTKNGDAQTVHLPSEAVAILQSRLDAADGSPWVFPGIGKTGHFTDATKPWRRVLERAGLVGVRVHDLRRTLGSWQAAAGVSLHVIGKSLGHKNQSTTAIYARLNLDPVRVAVDTAVDAMLKASSPNAANEP